MARIGINGFGRIGRYLVRLMAERNEFPVVINARADNASLAHLFKYDSVHHTFKGTVGHDENGIIINGTHIAVTRCKPNEWQWKDYGVDLVVESTGDHQEARRARRAHGLRREEGHHERPRIRRRHHHRDGRERRPL